MLIRDLEKGKSITALEALNRYGCFRLASRIYDLKKQGWRIDKKAIVKDGKTYASYFIPKGKRAALAK